VKTLEEVLEMQEVRLDQHALEVYIRREWVRPLKKKSGWVFEEIDIARLHLISQLVQDMQVNEEGMEVVLSLLDQLYGLRAHMKRLTHAVTRQPPEVQQDIIAIVKQMTDS